MTNPADRVALAEATPVRHATPTRPRSRYLSAAQAAERCGVSAKTVERWVKGGKLKARRAARNRFEIDPADLPGHLMDPLDELRAEIAALRRRVEELEQRLRDRERDSVRTSPYVSPDFTRPALPALAPRAAHTGYAASGGLRTYADAARFLARHSDINERTPKTWPQWAGVVPLEPRALLEDALRRKEESGYRAAWQLYQCNDPACVCQEVLPPGA